MSISNASPTTVPVDEFEITFTGTNSFTLDNLTTGASSGSFNFTTGSTFNLQNGFAVTITGSAAVGDRFIFSVSENAASKISISSDITSDTRRIAAGNTANGDGGNAQELADLQNSLVFTSVTLSSGSGSFTFDEFYNAIVSKVGIPALSRRRMRRQQGDIESPTCLARSAVDKLASRCNCSRIARSISSYFIGKLFPVLSIFWNKVTQYLG